MMGSALDIIELSRQLKQEKLFIDCERQQLHQLNTEVSKTADSLYCLSWITQQQKANLNDLVRASRDVTPVACCQKANTLEHVKFVDGYKSLTYHEAKVGEVLKLLRGNPQLVAAVLMHAETQGAEQLLNVAHAIMSGVFGNVVMQEDESLVLQVLKALIEQQLAVSDNPRRLLRKQSSAFGVFFKLFIEGLFSARLFVTAALHKPVMQLLMEDEWFYDIDPQRALHRFPPVERRRRFGPPETTEYTEKTERYRNRTATKLMNIAERFIVSLRNNMYCFPQSLGWLVSQLFKVMTSRDCVSATEARAMCADLVLALFICPAICDPEPLGITSDAPISYIARHNLMQVAQILQVLAISSGDVIESRQNDLYSKFEKECMLFLLSGLLDCQSSDQPPVRGNNSQMTQRTAMYMTMAELRQLLTILRTLSSSAPSPSADATAQAAVADVNTPAPPSGGGGGIERQKLCELLECVPSDSKLEEMQTKTTPNTTPLGTPPGTPVSKRKTKVKERQTRIRQLLTAESNGVTSDSEAERAPPPATEEVILISLGVINECPGMEAEEKIVEQENRQRKSRYNSLIPGEDDPISESDILANEKRTRFSLSHDQDSIATSDNLEAISEAASSHSLGSDIENDDENDNLSDMVSANVSGRGTPSISGRDTPLSQATGETDSQLEGQDEPEERRAAGPDLPVTVHKNNREDVTDKFQKFEIERDEIKSTVSDTWSTDVLASDSEPPEQNQMERLDEIAEEMVRQNLLGVQLHEACEALETASDAWSTDVLASDTSELQVERLLELEQEEVSSVGSRSQLQDDAEQSGVLGAVASDDTPQPSSVRSSTSEDRRMSADYGGDSAASAPADVSIEIDDVIMDSGDSRDPFTNFAELSESALSRFDTEAEAEQRNRKSKRGARDTNEKGQLDANRNIADRINTFVHSSDGVFREVAGDDENKKSDNMETGRRRQKNKAPGNDAKPREQRRNLPQVPNATAWEDRSDINSSADSGMGADQGGSSGLAMDESMTSLDSVASQLSAGLKLTEQQNLNIDDKRLSSVVDVFDPLAPPTAAPPTVRDSPATQNDTSQSDTRARSSVQQPQTSNKTPNCGASQAKVNYLEQGARPKIMINNQNVSPPKPGDRHQQHASTSARTSSPTVRFDPRLREMNGEKSATATIATSRSLAPANDVTGSASASSDAASGAAGAPDGQSQMQTGTVVAAAAGAMSRTGNAITMTSSTSSPARAVGSHMSTPDDSPIRPEGHVPDERKKSYSSGGLFKSFKDKFSKGSFSSSGSIYRNSGKARKSLKPHDKEERGVAVLIEIDSKASSTDSTPVKGGHGHLKNGQPDSDRSADSSLLETSDDILAKYRRSPAASSPRKATNHDDADDVDNKASRVVSVSRQNGPISATGGGEQPTPPAYDPANLENCKAFLDAKKKLRLVLSTADFQAIPLSGAAGGVLHCSPHVIVSDKKENELVSFLRAQLAEAINLQDKDLIARLHETIRCLAVFSNYETKKLLKSIRDEHRSRSPYTSYLIRCRQGLLGTQAHLERLLNRVQRDKTIVNKYMLAVNVRMFLEQREHDLVSFIKNFQQLTLADEKTEFVEQFLLKLHTEMNADPVWQMASDEQVDEAKVYIERNVMSHIYVHAMYPNGDGDMARDQLLLEHMKKLSKVITPNHKDLRIAKMYHYECPWPAAQNEIYMINAYKTPKDKLQCVLRCSSTIMNLLSLANEKSVPAADDFMPVLIYVLIKANPPSLLSTVQYVNSFYEKRLQGEEHYWWMQFTSAIVFIKTMDYDE